MKKEWYKSRTNWGAILIAGAFIVKAVGSYLAGDISLGDAINQVMMYSGGGLTTVGVRGIFK